ncbi:hypothetical protein AVEN_154739-1 [Araneus ventricosus]|uniref:Uncharacterized protein n=1 Tax=Araneus ventricosus TaxID=182803 RepID=A0A4Y2TNZ2_ARAVE|nr:hypothetical protein AVEN_154739-1 [Araneus ventricosus]
MAEKCSLCEDYVVTDKCGVGEKGIDRKINDFQKIPVNEAFEIFQQNLINLISSTSSHPNQHATINRRHRRDYMELEVIQIKEISLYSDHFLQFYGRTASSQTLPSENHAPSHSSRAHASPPHLQPSKLILVHSKHGAEESSSSCASPRSTRLRDRRNKKIYFIFINIRITILSPARRRILIRCPHQPSTPSQTLPSSPNGVIVSPSASYPVNGTRATATAATNEAPHDNSQEKDPQALLLLYYRISCFISLKVISFLK